MKSWLIAILIGVALAAGGGYWWYTQQQTESSSEPIDAIPESAVFLINYPDLNQSWDALEEQDYYEEFFGLEAIGRHALVNSLIDSLVRYDQVAKKLLDKSKLWTSYHPAENSTFVSLNVLQPQVASKELLESLKTALADRGEVKTFNFLEKPVLDAVLSDSETHIFATLRNGLLLVSESQSLLEEAITLLNGEPRKRSAQFLEALDVAGENVEANIIVNYQKLTGVDTDSIGKTTKWDAFASWTELDVSLKPNGATLNGFTLTKDSAKQFLNLFLEQTPQEIAFPEALPANTASFTFFGFSDALALSSDYREMLENANALEPFEAAIDSLEVNYGFNLEQNLVDLMGNSVGVCQLESENANNSFLILHTRSPELADKLLGSMSATIAEADGEEPTKQDFAGVSIQQLSIGDALNEFFPALGIQLNNPYYAVFNNYVIFAPSQNALENYLQYLQGDRTLAKDLAFTEFMQNLSSSFTVLSYKHLHRAAESAFPKSGLNPFIQLEKNEKQLKNFEACGIQLTTTGSSFYTNVFLNYNPKWQEADDNAWTAQLDAEPQTTPQFVKNHVTGETEVIVQDVEDQLYLFNAVGKRLFKREIAEPIESEIVQVDAFKNEKLQYIFNTKNYIYLIDRNGNNVDGFPVELASPAQTELSVIEYDNKRDYRLLIACKNKRIYNFDIRGKRVKGWRHNKVGHLTIHPFKHLLVNRKDYLITGEEHGKIHLLDRRGKNRVKVERYVEPSKNNHLQTFKSSISKWNGVYITDKDGLVHIIALDGEVTTMNLGKFSPEHHFMVSDLDNDGSPEFIFYDLNMVQVLKMGREKVFEQRVAPSATDVQIFDLADGNKGIGFCFEDAQQLVMYDNRGEMIKGFPVSGNSAYSITTINGKRTLVTAGGDKSLTIVSLD